MSNFSQVAYIGDGGTGPYGVPFSFLDRSHVSVSVDGTPAEFVWVTDGSVSLAAPAASGSAVVIARTTPRDVRLVDFTDGSVLTEADLDTALQQQMNIAQEVVDEVSDVMRADALARFDAQGRRLVNLGAPTDGADAATKAYVDAATPASAAAAAASSAASATASQTAAASSAAAAAASAAALSGAAVPAGGATGQRLAKTSAEDGAAAWVDNLADGEVTGAKLAAGGVGLDKLEPAAAAGYVGAAAAGGYVHRTSAQLRADVISASAPAATPSSDDSVLFADVDDGGAVKRASVAELLALGGGLRSVAQGALSGTDIDITIPAGAEMIRLSQADLNWTSNDTDPGRFIIGDAGGLETSGYDSFWRLDFTGFNYANDSYWAAAFGYIAASLAGPCWCETDFYHHGSNKWSYVSRFVGVRTTGGDSRLAIAGGSKTLSGELTTLRMQGPATQSFTGGTYKAWAL